MKPLLSGLDTVECAYYLRLTAQCTINFRQLDIEKEVLRQSKKREPRKIEIGGIDFFLQPYGTGSGYPFLIENEDMSIEFGEFNEPSFFVTYRSIALWHKGGGCTTPAIHRLVAAYWLRRRKERKPVAGGIHL